MAARANGRLSCEIATDSSFRTGNELLIEDESTPLLDELESVRQPSITAKLEDDVRACQADTGGETLLSSGRLRTVWMLVEVPSDYTERHQSRRISCLIDNCTENSFLITREEVFERIAGVRQPSGGIIFTVKGIGVCSIQPIALGRIRYVLERDPKHRSPLRLPLKHKEDYVLVLPRGTDMPADIIFPLGLIEFYKMERYSIRGDLRDWLKRLFQHKTQGDLRRWLKHPSKENTPPCAEIEKLLQSGENKHITISSHATQIRVASNIAKLDPQSQDLQPIYSQRKRELLDGGLLSMRDTLTPGSTMQNPQHPPVDTNPPTSVLPRRPPGPQTSSTCDSLPPHQQSSQQLSLPQSSNPFQSSEQFRSPPRLPLPFTSAATPSVASQYVESGPSRSSPKEAFSTYHGALAPSLPRPPDQSTNLSATQYPTTQSSKPLKAPKRLFDGFRKRR